MTEGDLRPGQTLTGMILHKIGPGIDVLQANTVRLPSGHEVGQFNHYLETNHYLESSRLRAIHRCGAIFSKPEPTRPGRRRGNGLPCHQPGSDRARRTPTRCVLGAKSKLFPPSILCWPNAPPAQSHLFFRACPKIGKGAATGDFGLGRGGDVGASPWRAVTTATTKPKCKSAVSRIG